MERHIFIRRHESKAMFWLREAFHNAAPYLLVIAFAFWVAHLLTFNL